METVEMKPVDSVEAQETEAAAAETKKNPRVVDLKNYQPKQPMPFFKAFYVEFKCKDGTVLSGNFVAKRLTLGDQSKLGVRVAALEGGLVNVADSIHVMNTWIAHCEAALVEKPDWFNPTEMYDLSLVGEVYSKIIEWEGTFRG